MKNLIVYIRFLSKHKTLSVINVLGLSIGIATCIFIGLYIAHELSYDQYHKNIDRIFTITTKVSGEAPIHIPTVSKPLAPELKLNFPEVKEAIRLKPLGNPTVGYQNNFFKEPEIFEADPQIFDVFTYNLIKGNPSTALTGSNNMVITTSLARKYFGQDDPVNKTLLIDNKEYQITGVMEDVPSNSDLRFSALVSIDKTHEDDWFDTGYYTYVLFHEDYLKGDASTIAFQQKLTKLSEQKYNDVLKESGGSLSITMLAEPLKGVHFRQPLYDDTPKGNIKYIYIIASVALLMLFIGSLNFINFSLVQSMQRGKEVGIRKVIGAKYHQLVLRYLSESLVVTFIAFVTAMVMVTFLMPVFNNITSKSFQVSDLVSIRFVGVAFVLIIIVGTLAGSYPAFFTSSIKPLQSLTGKITNIKGMSFRKISIMAQFAIAIGLIICTLLTYRQMEFISNYNLGFRKDNIVVIDASADSLLASRMKVFKESLLKNENIEKVSNLGYGALPGIAAPNIGDVKTEVGGQAKFVNFSYVDEDYFETLDIVLTKGRNFDPARISDRMESVIVNEAFAKAWGWKDNELDRKIFFDFSRWKGKEIKVIGIMKNIHSSSLYNPVKPAIFFYDDTRVDDVLIRFNNNYPVTKQTSLLEQEWKKIFPDQAFMYKFLDQSIAAQYIQEEKAVKLFTIFSSLTILVSCLGLFGLCSLTISQRKKEVGIRKIIGADFISIVALFSKEYLILIGLSFVIVTPISVFMINRWLETFPVKEGVSISVFIITGMGVTTFAMLTIILSIAKTSSANPSDLIRE